MSLKVVANTKCLLGESPLWDERTKSLWWVDILQSKLYRLPFGTPKFEMWDLPQATTALAGISGRDELLLACTGALMRFEPKTAVCQEIIPFELEKPENRPNDGKCDPQGRFWIGSMDDAEEQNNGSLYRLGHDLSLTPILKDLGIPNTLAWSPDRKIFYFADSQQQTIWAFDYDDSSGDISNKRNFVSLEGTDIYPDGSCIDREGYLWNAQWNGWRLVRYAPDGMIDRIIKIPVACPTSCMFGGQDLKTLYITSACKGQSNEALMGQPFAGAVFSLNLDVGGLMESPFRMV